MFESLGDGDWTVVAKMIKSPVKITMEQGTTLKAPTVRGLVVRTRRRH